MDNNEINIYFQPKISLKDYTVFGAEILARWIKKDGTMIPPDKFIRYAEKNGLIVALGEYIIEKSFLQISNWQIEKKPFFVLSINISMYQLEEEEFFYKTMQLVEKYNVNVKRLELEITESALMKNYKLGLEHLNNFKKAGISISLDDFGTGYSSFSYMLQFPINAIKLDKSMIQKEIFSEKGKIFLESFIDLCHKQNFRVIAEGIETEDQLALLAKMNCDEIQGFYFSKPLNKNDFENFLISFKIKPTKEDI